MSLDSRPGSTVAVTVGQVLADEGRIFLALIDELNLGTGTAEKDIFLLRNPVASGVRIQFKEIVLVTTKVSGGTSIRYYRNPTVTAAGTALTVENKKTDSITGVGTAFQLPTISARGVKLDISGAAGAGELRHDENFEVELLEGEDLLFTINQPSANNTYSMNVIWAELDL